MNNKNAMTLAWATHSYNFIKKMGLMKDFEKFLMEEEGKEGSIADKLLMMATHIDLGMFLEDENDRAKFFVDKTKDVDLASMSDKKREKFLMKLAEEYNKKEDSEK